MTNEAFDLMKDTSEKAKTARSANYKNGRITTKAQVRSEHYYRSKNGDTLAYNLNAPMDWELFLKISNSEQEQYVRNLMDIYNVPIEELGRMFGVKVNVLRPVLINFGMTTYFIKGSFKKEEWEEFLKKTNFPKKPLDWKSFKALGINQQKDYINWLVDEYKINSVRPFEKMFGLTSWTIGDYLSEKLDIRFKKGGNRYGTANLQNENRFYEFIESETSNEEICIIDDIAEPLYKGKKLSWKEFKSLGLNIQKEYLQWLVATFNISGSRVSKELFGLSRAILPAYSRETLGFCFARAVINMTEEQEENWKKFLSEEYFDVAEEETIEELSEDSEEISESPVEIEPAEKSNEFVCKEESEEHLVETDDEKSEPEQIIPDSFSINFSGELDLIKIFNSLKAMLGEKLTGNISIDFNK